MQAIREKHGKQTKSENIPNPAEFIEFMMHNLHQKHDVFKISKDMQQQLKYERQRQAFDRSNFDMQAFTTILSDCDFDPLLESAVQPVL